MTLSPQEPSARINYIVLLTCVICLVTYVVMAVILHKLDRLDVSRVRVIPFCGKGGRFKYEILVKTGWSRGSGKERGDWVEIWSLPWSRCSSLDPGPCLVIMETVLRM